MQLVVKWLSLCLEVLPAAQKIQLNHTKKKEPSVFIFFK